MSKKGYISKENLYPVIIEDKATDDTLTKCYNDIKQLVRKEKRQNNDSTIRKG